MFGEFQFGAGEFAGTQAIPIPTPVTPTTITRLKLECATVTCATETDVGVYSLQDEIPSRSVAAAECLTNDCSGVDPDVQSYSLQDALYFNGTPITVPVICPVGADCTPGSFPPTITFPPGTFVIPDVPTTPGQPIILQLTGCQSTVSVTLPATATQAEINAAVNYIIEQVALQQAQCDSFPEFPFTTSVSLGTFVSAACLNSGFAASISASSTPESYPLSFGIVGGSLPPGISLTSSSSTVAFFSGTPTVAGNYTFTLRAVTASGAVGTRTYNIAIGGISTASLATAITGEDYLETLTATGISGTLLWGIAGGSLPPGLTLNSSTGVISGIPTTEDSYPVTFFVQNSFQQCTRSFTITVDNCVIDNASPLPEATAGEVYSTTLTASDITGTLTWSIISGALPNGLSLNAVTGEISGTPDTDGTYNFTAQVTSGDNTCQKAFELEVTVCIITTASPLPEATNGTPYSTTLAALDITGTLTWSLVLGALPDGLSLNSATGEISGTPTTDETQNFTIQVSNGLGNICNKEFSLTVAAVGDCPDWASLSWVQDADVETGDGVTTINTISGGSIDVECTCGEWFGGPNNQGYVGYTGTVAYSGAGGDCCVDINATMSPPAFGAYWELYIANPGVIAYYGSPVATSNGVKTFTMPAGSYNVEVHFIVSADAGFGYPGAKSTSLIATFQACP
jgi:hypothetical protein